MKKKIYVLALALALALTLVAFISGSAGRSAAAPANDAVSALPASDIVITVDTQRLLSETLPTIFADNQALLSKVNDKIAEFNKETGVDLRTFDSLAVGLRFKSSSGGDFDAVVVARGHFNANEVIDAGFAAGERKGEVQKREEQYEGKTIFIAASQRRTGVKDTVPSNTSVVVNSNGGGGKVAVLAPRSDVNANVSSSQPVIIGKTEEPSEQNELPAAKTTDQYDVKVEGRHPEQMAIVALDANTIAVGDLKSVKAAIDANLGRERVDDELVRMATQNPSALVGFSGKIPPSVTEKMAAANRGQESKYFASIRQFYGSFSTTGTDAETFIAVRTENAGQANDISQALSAVKLLSGFGGAQGPNGEGASLARMLKGLSITTHDNEVQIKLNIKQKELAPFMRKF